MSYHPITVDIAVEADQWHLTFPDIEDKLTAVCENTLSHILPDNAVFPLLEISIVLTDDDAIQRLNQSYRDKNAPTNVLSFPQYQFKPGEYAELCEEKTAVATLGDIILSFSTLKQEAEQQHKTLEAHCTHLLVHGLLHLLGYDHMTEEEAALMEKTEISILSRFGIPSPYEVSH